jgi:NAD(P)-dependent dehydrogenase (short-subunit alcohol dehydrogenase family)
VKRWKDVEDTPMKRYDLINAVNSRGTFACTRAVLPHMLKQGFGRIITMSPPISLVSDFDKKRNVILMRENKNDKNREK